MDKIDILWTREKIRNRLSTYCHGIDRRNWGLVRSCFGEEHLHQHGPFTGSADDFVKFASGLMEEIALSHHSVSNFKIDISEDGLTAHCDANFIAFHRIEEGQNPKMSVPTHGQAMDWIVAGRYVDDLVLRDGEWLIVKRHAVNDWHRLEPMDMANLK